RDNVQSVKDLLEVTKKRLMEINAVRDAGGFRTAMISRPGPGGKISPNTMQIVLGGLLLGLLAGLGLAYVADRADKSFRTPDEIRVRLGLPVIGHIPIIPEDEQAKRMAAPRPDPVLCAHWRPKSLEAEAFRAVRTSLYFSTRGE